HDLAGIAQGATAVGGRRRQCDQREAAPLEADRKRRQERSAMMRANRFRYVAARSIVHASAALADAGPGAMLIAGGTDLVPNMKRRQQTPAVVIGLRRVPELRLVGSTTEGGLTVGACTTLSDVAAHPQVRAHYGALFRAAAQVATPPIRNMATLGGNLCLDTRCNYYNQNYEWRRSIDFCMKAPHGPAVATRAADGDAGGAGR